MILSPQADDFGIDNRLRVYKDFPRATYSIVETGE